MSAVTSAARFVVDGNGRLDVEKRNIKATDLKEIGKLENLRELNLSGNRIDIFDLPRKDRAAPLAFLKGCKELVVLEMRGVVNNEDFGVDQLEELSQFSKLQVCDLSGGKFQFDIPGEEFEKFQNILGRMAALTQLIVKGCEDDFTPARLAELRKSGKIKIVDQ